MDMYILYGYIYNISTLLLQYNNHVIVHHFIPQKLLLLKNVYKKL